MEPIKNFEQFNESKMNEVNESKPNDVVVTTWADHNAKQLAKEILSDEGKEVTKDDALSWLDMFANEKGIEEEDDDFIDDVLKELKKLGVKNL